MFVPNRTGEISPKAMFSVGMSFLFATLGCVLAPALLFAQGVGDFITLQEFKAGWSSSQVDMTGVWSLV